jgi:ABC-type sugar transport system substrate-binding protein
MGGLTLFAVSIAAAGAACRDVSSDVRSATSDRTRQGYVAFIGAGPGDPLWPVLRAGAKRYLAAGSPLEIRLFNSPTDIPEAQADLLGKLNDPDLRGVCVEVKDVDAVASPLEHLVNRGLVVVTMIESGGPRARSTHVGLDDTQVGEALANCATHALGDKGGSVMVLHAGDNHPIYGPRHLAFMEKMRRNSRIAILADLDCKGDPAQARRIIQERSARYPRLDLWVAMDDWPLADDTSPRDVFPRGRQGPRYITFGGLPRQWPLVRDGLCPCIVAADYGAIAGRAAQFCISGVREPTQERRDFYVPLKPVNMENLDEYRRDWFAWAGQPLPASDPAR